MHEALNASRTRRSRAWSPVWIVVLASCSASAANSAATPGEACVGDEAALTRTILEVQEKQGNVGLSAALRLGDAVVLDTAFGFGDLEHRVPATSRTVFGVASVTKAVTAVAVLKLWSAGRLDLDAPVQRYVPSFPVRPEGTITPRLLATHRSGLPHPSDRTPELFATHYATATDALEVFRDVELAATPGERRVYSSSNYNLLAAIVESITGTSFQAWVRDEVIAPTGMTDTRFDQVLAAIPHRSRRYSFYHPWTYEETDTLLRVPAWDYSFDLGGGGLLSTSADLARFGGRLLRPGDLLPRPAWELFYSDSWFGRVDDDGRRWMLITGANPGVQAALVVHPELDAAAALLANTWGIGARSGEMVGVPLRLIRQCAGEPS